LESDRTVFPTGAQVHLTLTDLQLNIDPTDEDSWTWATAGSTATFYQLFDEDGDRDADGTGGAVDISPLQTNADYMIEKNSNIFMDVDAQSSGTEVLRIVNNDDSRTNGTSTVDATTVSTDGSGTITLGNTDGTVQPPNQPVTFTELIPNSGIFTNYDNADVSNLAINADAPRGKSGTIDYNDTPKTVLVGLSFATIDMFPVDDEWNSGEVMPIVVVDNDANLNSRVDEDLDLNLPDVPLIPALKTGAPFTLGFSGVECTLVSSSCTQAAMYLDTAVVLTSSASGVFALSGLGSATNVTAAIDVNKFSERAILDATADLTNARALVIDYGATAEDLFGSIASTAGDGIENRLHGFNLFNQDLRSINGTGSYDIFVLNNTVSVLTFTDPTLPGAAISDGTTAISIVNNISAQSINLLNVTNSDITAENAERNAANAALFSMTQTDNIGLLIIFGDGTATGYDIENNTPEAIVSDFFSFGFNSDGDESGERVANQIIRIEVEESGDNTSTFEGTLEYIMVNQINILDPVTYTKLAPVDVDPTFIVIEDLTDEDSPRVNYLDLGADGVSTQIAAQEEAPSHSGIVSFDGDSYKIADTVTITVEDLDLNVDSDLIDIYTVVADPTDDVFDQVGKAGLLTDLSFGDLGKVLDVTFDDGGWVTPAVGTCSSDGTTTGTFLEATGADTGLGATGFTLIETGQDTGILVGDFQVPTVYCPTAGTTTAPDGPGTTRTTTGLDIEVNYVDFRDASGEIIEVGDSAGIRANTGSVSLDRTVYPVPFGVPSNFAPVTNSNSPEGRSIFPVHQTGLAADGDTTIGGATSGEFLPNGDLALHIRVNDPDFDISATGEDVIAEDTADNPVGPVKISVKRASATVVLGFAGNSAPVLGVIDVGDNAATDSVGVFGTDFTSPAVIPVINEVAIRQFGPMVEIAPDAGIFEIDISIRYTDGPASSTCPVTEDFTPTQVFRQLQLTQSQTDLILMMQQTVTSSVYYKEIFSKYNILILLMHQVTKTLSLTLLHLT
jgi:hypothetical protein